jgi:serine/threonine-protein kinase
VLETETMYPHANTAEFEGAPSVPAIGEVIAGKYRVESVVGSGGMGVVLCATHLELGQRVAIKVLTVPEDDARRIEAHERFVREGRATAALVSDHVVRIYDVGTLQSGAPFMVMELLRGQDLARTLQQNGPLSIELSCDCIRQAAEAIGCAHARGIVHRDLKPSNLFLTERSDGSPLVKVLDFGISKTMGTELEPLTGNLTETRSVLGTPFYMSPEQVRDAKKVDARTDIWSLGLILHELLSASPAFEGTTLPSVCAAIAADPPAALRLKRPEVPVEVEAIVNKCLEKDPDRRFQSARELFDTLTPWAGRGASALPSSLSDRTIRSSSIAFELREGSTISLPSDTGTMASAVLSQSGERVVGGPGSAQVKIISSKVPSASTSTSGSGPALGKGKTIAASASALVGLGLIIAWALAGHRAAPQAAPTASAASLPLAIPPPSRVPSFSVLIESNPALAQVFEGEALLGTTPLRLSVDPANGPQSQRTFSLRKPGYLPYTIVQGAATQDTRILAELSRAPTEAQAPSATSTRPRPDARPPHAKSVAEPGAAPAEPARDIFMQR